MPVGGNKWLSLWIIESSIEPNLLKTLIHAGGGGGFLIESINHSLNHFIQNND